SLVMDADKQVTGVFEKRQYPLTLTIEGNGTVKEEVIAMATQSQYPSGTTIRLTAQPGEGYSFKDWSGDLVSKDNPVQVLIQKPVSISANFGLKPFVPQGEPLKGVNLTTRFAQNQKVFPGQYLTSPVAQKMGIQIGQYPDAHIYNYWDPSKAYLDFNQDGRLDMFAFLTHSGPNVFGDAPGKVFLINDVWGPKPIITQHDCPTRFMPRLSTVDVDNDGRMEILFTSEDDHMLSNGTYGLPSQTKYAVISKEGNVTYKPFGEAISIHGQSFGDIDQDGDVDIVNWRNSLTNAVGKSYPSMPIFYLNDGKGNFETADVFQYIKGLDQIIKDLGYATRSYGAQAIELFDVDGDNILDLLVSADHRIKVYEDWNYGHNTTRIYWGLGKGKFDFLNNYTDLPNNYTDDYNNASGGGTEPLGFSFLDFDKDGDIDIVSTITPDYGGYFLQLHENKGGKKFVDVTKERITGYFDRYDRRGNIPAGSFTNFYNIRFNDKDGDGDLDIVPDAVAIWGLWTTPLATNLYWENQGGKFVRK
ncbi:MAG: VCBS repeat-containing protein, partial [Aquirufa sp.]